MGSREGLMQVDMKDVDAEISGPRYPHHRIQVRAIHIHKRTMRMNRLRNAGNLTFKNTQSVGIRNHDRSHVVVHEFS